ncbi:MAG: hypothetical protein ABFD92_16755 [Planctomycetaceae bacterium]|nr:hypothetical protein [Planctomycetaceae bacterium]
MASLVPMRRFVKGRRVKCVDFTASGDAVAAELEARGFVEEGRQADPHATPGAVTPGAAAKAPGADGATGGVNRWVFPGGKPVDPPPAPIARRPLVVVTAWSTREHDIGPIIETHAALQGVDRFVWLANGVDRLRFRQLDRASSRLPVTLARTAHTQSIAQAYNLLLIEATADAVDADVLVIQDDVMVTPDLPAALSASRYDLPAAWHDDRPRRGYEIGGYPYVVNMAVLIRRRLFDRMGFFNELFVRGVDAEYGVRASVAGLSCGFIEAPTVHHVGHITTHGDNGSVRQLHRQAHRLIEALLEWGRIGMRVESAFVQHPETSPLFKF